MLPYLAAGFLCFQIGSVRSECCTIKAVPGTDMRSGTYLLNKTDFNLPEYCNDMCAYTKQGDNSGDIYCFGHGNLSSECTGTRMTNNILPPGPGEELEEDDSESFGYLVNDIPGNNTNNITCGDTIRINDETWSNILMIDSLKMANDNSNTAWSNSELVLRRLDGESAGAAAFNHLIGIFAKNPANSRWYRLDVAAGTTATTNTAATRFKIVGADGAACTGAVQYETNLRIVTEDDAFMVDLHAGTLVGWVYSNDGTKLHLDTPPAL